MAAPTGLPVSVQTRLVQHAKAIGIDPNLVLTRYATERILYRLSQSAYADRFILKGALLMLVWLGETVRPTRDADLLGFGDLSEDSLAQCAEQVAPDGLEYLAPSIRVAAIREGDAYGGLRVTIQARLGNARLPVQIDVGFGDALVPEPEWLEYPGLLDLPRPRLRAYRPETAIAEKFHAMVVLGEANSRMRDFFDIYALAKDQEFGDDLVQAVRATFERRRTVIPSDLVKVFSLIRFDIDPSPAAHIGEMRGDFAVFTTAAGHLHHDFRRSAHRPGDLLNQRRGQSASPL